MKAEIDRFYKIIEPFEKPKSQLNVKIKGYNDTFDIDLIDVNGKPDCCIGHFGYNFYFRTNKGMKETKYKNLNTLFKAVTAKAKSLGLEVESFGLRKGYKYRAIS